MLRQVLVIENDDGIAEQINAQPSLMSCKVKQVHDGRLGLAEAVSGNYDLLIRDMAPPETDGR